MPNGTLAPGKLWPPPKVLLLAWVPANGSTCPAGSAAAAAGRSRTAITMVEVVEALEGQIAPMECFHETPEGNVLCSHESDGDQACATKLLWTRVQSGVSKALAGTTLAELVEFAGPRPNEQSREAV